MTSEQHVYGPEDLADFDAASQLGDPGSFPYTRGPYPTMYGGRLWTMRQYAGFGTARATNERFRALLDAGQTGLSFARLAGAGPTATDRGRATHPQSPRALVR